jgi:hypothetical protein
MMRIFFALLLLMGIGYGQTVQEQKKPTTLFGITLGKPYDYQALPHCKAPSAMAEAPDVNPCWELLSGHLAPTIKNVPYLADLVSLEAGRSSNIFDEINGHRTNGPIIRISTLVGLRRNQSQVRSPTFFATAKA